MPSLRGHVAGAVAVASPCVSLGKGMGLWVAGPARVVVEAGQVLAAGFVVGAGEEAVVRATRGFTFFSLEDGSRVCVVQGSGGGYRVVEEGFREAVEWVRLGERLKTEGVRRVVVIGPVEAGKSTLTLFLANILGVAVLEADVGQNELGTPACVSYASPPQHPALSLEELSRIGCVFVGHVSAEKVAPGVVTAAAEAARRLESYVADTDGFVAGTGVAYKAWLVEAMKPDMVVSLGAPAGLVSLLRARGFRVENAPRPPLPRWRSRLDRRSFRARLWARLFSRPSTLVLQDVTAGPLCSHTVLQDREVLYTCGDMAIMESRRRPAEPGLRWLRPGWARGLLAGLHVGDGDVPAVVENYDASTGRLVVRAAWPPEREVVGIALGWVRLGENFSEEHLPVEPHPLAAATASRGRPRRQVRGAG